MQSNLQLLGFIFVLVLLGCSGASKALSENDEKAIDWQLRQMEALLKQKDMKGLAAIYLAEGYLLSPGGSKVTGREQIDAYWERFTNPVDWKLETLATSKDPAAIFAHEHYKAMKNKPPGWAGLGLDLDGAVYQLGISNLKTIWQGQERTSVVDYILLWKKQPGGDWKILVDTYVSNN